MAGPADDIGAWLEGLSDNIAGDLAAEFADVVEEELVQPIRDAAPVGATGNLKASVRKEPGADEFEWIVAAGGPLTTKSVRAAARDVSYDYAIGVEFGTSNMPAQPFFWPTLRAQNDSFQERMQEIIDDAADKQG